MSMADLERLTTDLQENPNLAEEFESLGDDATAWAQLAATRSYVVTAQEVEDLCSGFEELSDDDLEEAAGGWTGT